MSHRSKDAKLKLTWDIKPFIPWMKSDFLKCKKFNYVLDFARCKKLRIKTDFDLVIVEGSKLGMKSNYNCRKKNLNSLLENNINLAVRRKQEHILLNFKSDFNTDKSEKQNRCQQLNIINLGQSELRIFIMFSCWKSVFVFHFCLCVKIGLEIKICSCFCLIAKIILFSNNVFNFFSWFFSTIVIRFRSQFWLLVAVPATWSGSFRHSLT